MERGRSHGRATSSSAVARLPKKREAFGRLTTYESLESRLYCYNTGKFLPFKTPLAGSFADLPEDRAFSPDMLLEAVSGRGLTMGLVVDLTKTDRCPYLPCVLSHRI